MLLTTMKADWELQPALWFSDLIFRHPSEDGPVDDNLVAILVDVWLLLLQPKPLFCLNRDIVVAAFN